MTYIRSMITAGTAALLIHAKDLGAVALVLLCAGIAWLGTTDPVAPAVTRGLEEFAKRYRK